jgi:DNA polymerase-1
MGPVKAKAFLDRAGSIPGEISGGELPETWAAIVEAFEDKELTAEDALQQARVARILRPLDWDEEAQKPILWGPV